MSAPENHRVRLTIQYDGSGFHGWQVQPEVRTVQQELEAALERLTSTPVRTIAAGRTDTGVHATGQVAGADVPLRWEPARLRRALNAVLPGDVWIAAAESVAPDFHARYDATAREYEYRLGTRDVAWSPFHRRWCWALRDAVDEALLDEAAALVVGEHSFRAFAKAGQEERGDRCTVYAAGWEAAGPDATGPRFRIRANRFLHHMVRYLVGTMVDVARGRRPLAEMHGLLENEAGLTTSPPAPPEGLYLVAVTYDAERKGTT